MKTNALPAALLGLSAALVMSNAGCAKSETPSESARFLSLPKDCTGLARPIDAALHQFAGRLHNDRGENGFDESDLSPAPSPQYVRFLMCSISYGDSSAPQRHESGARPRSRFLTVTFTLDSSPGTPVSHASESFGRYRDGFSRNKMMLNGIGDEAFTGIESRSGDKVVVKTVFRISNLTVDVFATGSNFSGTDDVGIMESPQLFSDVKSGAESIAKAIADHIDDIMPAK
ncbi:hypothetical protein [Nocardia beijingensis]|uniref:hypothetical protein n=1 Tax=Nocardia beijingensis TaxID=95162 RepID=UPI003407CC13